MSYPVLFPSPQLAVYCIRVRPVCHFPVCHDLLHLYHLVFWILRRHLNLNTCNFFSYLCHFPNSSIDLNSDLNNLSSVLTPMFPALHAFPSSCLVCPAFDALWSSSSYCRYCSQVNKFSHTFHLVFPYLYLLVFLSMYSHCLALLAIQPQLYTLSVLFFNFVVLSVCLWTLMI